MHFNARKHASLTSNFNFKIAFGGTLSKFHGKLLNRYGVAPSSCTDCIC